MVIKLFYKKRFDKQLLPKLSNQGIVVIELRSDKLSTGCKMRNALIGLVNYGLRFRQIDIVGII